MHILNEASKISEVLTRNIHFIYSQKFTKLKKKKKKPFPIRVSLYVIMIIQKASHKWIIAMGIRTRILMTQQSEHKFYTWPRQNKIGKMC